MFSSFTNLSSTRHCCLIAVKCVWSTVIQEAFLKPAFKKLNFGYDAMKKWKKEGKFAPGRLFLLF